MYLNAILINVNTANKRVSISIYKYIYIKTADI